MQRGRYGQRPDTYRLVVIQAGKPPTYEPQEERYSAGSLPVAEEEARTLSHAEQCVVVVQSDRTHEYVYRAFCGRNV